MVTFADVAVLRTMVNNSLIQSRPHAFPHLQRHRGLSSVDFEWLNRTLTALESRRASLGRSHEPPARTGSSHPTRAARNCVSWTVTSAGLHHSIENMMGTVRRVCRNVKRCRNAAMALRWTAAG
jgi:hypothetical protein